MKKHFLMAALAVLPALSGCLPLVATGVGTGAAVVDDPRSTGTQLDDTNIKLTIDKMISNQLAGTHHIDVTCYDRVVLLTGEIPSVDTIAQAQHIAESVNGVRRVQNELRMMQPTSLSTRARDALITTKVKAALFDNKNFDSNHIKVVTEDGNVYLMGLIRRDQAPTVANIVRNIEGVTRVVELFEYTDQAAGK